MDYNMKGVPFLGVQYPSFLGSTQIGSSTLTPTTDSPAHLTSVSLGGGQTLLRLSIPFQETITEQLTGFSPTATGTINLVFSGSIAAYAIVPEPSSIVLGLFAAAGLFTVASRQRRAIR
ncbi:MAG TPA: PEP-CTERM sorting domain-containing protein [Pirellulales bacterium]|jgi:hypothetical protein